LRRKEPKKRNGHENCGGTQLGNADGRQRLRRYRRFLLTACCHSKDRHRTRWGGPGEEKEASKYGSLVEKRSHNRGKANVLLQDHGRSPSVPLRKRKGGRTRVRESPHGARGGEAISFKIVPSLILRGGYANKKIPSPKEVIRQHVLPGLRKGNPLGVGVGTTRGGGKLIPVNDREKSYSSNEKRMGVEGIQKHGNSY